MLKAFIFRTSIYRNSSKVILPINQDNQAMNLDAKTEKSRKKHQLGKGPAWLHQDVRIGIKMANPKINHLELFELTEKILNDTMSNTPSLHPDKFFKECIKKLGITKFERFIEFNEHNIPKLKNSKYLREYLSTCLEIFNHDASLLKMLVMCNIKSINKKSAAKIDYKKLKETNDKKSEKDSESLKIIPMDQSTIKLFKRLDKNIDLNLKQKKKIHLKQQDGFDLKSGGTPEKTQ